METPQRSDAKIAVLGGNGMLGTDLSAVLAAQGYQPVAYDLPDFDICQPQHVQRALHDATAVINCAAYTNVDGAESDRDIARAVNGVAVGDVGRAAAERGIYVLHISTDFVFDGATEAPYTETDQPNPLSVYGSTKLGGEAALVASGCEHAIVRVEWTYGAAGRNFVTKLLERASTNPALKMVADQTGSPTWTVDVARALAELLEQRTQGLYHYAADGYATRYEVAEFILHTLGLGNELTPCRTADFPAAAQRPLNSRFCCDKIDGILQRPRPHWQSAMRTFLATIGQNMP